MELTENKQARQNFTSATDKDQIPGLMALDSLRTQMSVVRQRMQSKENEVLKFKTDISIQKRTLGTTKGDLVYYVIEVKSVKQIKNSYDCANSMNSSSFSLRKSQSVVQKQKSLFSKSETIQQAITMSSYEQFEEDINVQGFNINLPDGAIAESEGESKISSTSVAKLQSKQKIVNKKKKNKNKVIDLNESQGQLLINKDIMNNSMLNQSQAQDTNRSLPESEIMIEKRFISLNDTQQGQLIQKSMSREDKGFKEIEIGLNLNKNQMLVDFDNSFMKQSQRTDNNQIDIDINQLNYTTQNEQVTTMNDQVNNTAEDNDHKQSQMYSSESQKEQAEKKTEKKSLKASQKTSLNKSVKTMKSQKKDSAYERYKQSIAKKKLNESTHELSISLTENDKEGLGEKLKLGSSINGDENDKIRQIDKFSYFEAFTEQKTQPQSLRILKGLKFFEFLTMIITSVIIATSINNFLSSFIEKSDSILFRGYLMVPYSSFTTTEFILRQVKSLPSFPDQNEILTQLDKQLEQQYMRFQTNMTESYQKTNLITQFSNDYINIVNAQLILSDKSGNTPNNDENQNRLDTLYSNFTLIDSLGQLFYHLNNILETVIKLHYQQFKQQFNNQNIIIIGIKLTEKALSTENEIQSIIFEQHNYKNFIGRSLENIESQFNDTIEMKESLNVIIIVISTLMIFFTFVVFIVIILNYKLFQQKMVQIFNIITTVKTSSVENEIIRVRSILECLKENDEIIEKYNFSIRQKEYELTKFSDDEEQIKQNQDQRKRKALYVKINQQKLSNVRFYIVSSFTMILFFIYIVVNLFVNINFLDTFKPALQYLDDFGRMSFEIPSLLSYASIIQEYNLKNPQLFQEADIQNIKQLYSNSLKLVTDFSQIAYDIKKKDFFSKSFVESFNDKMKDNLCIYYPDIPLKQCQELFNGSLTSGLVNALSTWKEFFNQMQNIEFQFTNTIEFYRRQMLILDFSLILNESMMLFTQIIYHEVKSVIKAQQNLVLLFAIIFSVLITLPKIYELTIEYQTISSRFFIAKKIVFMLPLYTLMIEETFNKMLKAIGNQLDIKR